MVERDALIHHTSGSHLGVWSGEEGAVAVSSSVFLAHKLFPPAFLAPTSLGRDRLNRRETTLSPPWDSQRPISPPNSSRLSFSLQPELWVALRFLSWGLDSKEKFFFPPFQPPLGSFCSALWRRRWKDIFLKVFLAIYLPVSEVSSGRERPSGTLSWRLGLEKLAAVLKTAFLCRTLCQQYLPFLSTLDLSACLCVRIWLMSWLVSVKGLY